MLINRAENHQQLNDKNPQTKDGHCVQVEYCHNCDSHLLTVKHSQHKYVTHFEHIKEYLGQKGITVKKKPTPIELFKQSPYCPPHVYYTHNGDIVHYPRIGSFEVFLGDQLIFSKLEHNKWPTPEFIQSQIKRLQVSNPNTKDIRLSEQPTADHQLLSSREAKTIGDIASKSFHLKWQKKQSQNQRYSLSRRNLFSKSDRQNKTTRSVNATVLENKIEEKEEAEIIKMYSPVPKKDNVGKREIENLPTLEGKARAIKASIYLQPIYPKTRVSYQNYQKHKIIYTQKIHQEKVAYDLEKARKEAQKALKIKQQMLQKQRKVHRPILYKIREKTQQQPKLHVLQPEKNQKVKEKKVKKDNVMVNSLELPQIKNEEAQWSSYKQAIQKEKEDQAQKKYKTNFRDHDKKQHELKNIETHNTFNQTDEKNKEKQENIHPPAKDQHHQTSEEIKEQDREVKQNDKGKDKQVSVNDTKQVQEDNKIGEQKEEDKEKPETKITEKKQKQRYRDDKQQAVEGEGKESQKEEKTNKEENEKQDKEKIEQKQQQQIDKNEGSVENLKKERQNSQEKVQEPVKMEQKQEVKDPEQQSPNEHKEDKIEGENIEKESEYNQQKFQQQSNQNDKKEPEGIPNSELKSEEDKKVKHEDLPLESKQLLEKQDKKSKEKESEEYQNDKFQGEQKKPQEQESPEMIVQ